MLDKIGHIKNPLTVIAMFAAIAEVSGAVVLPFIATANQATYIWFLMTFPVVLVLIFFATLNFNHNVLYAPSDWKDEANFFRMFTKASAAERKEKLQDEVAASQLAQEPLAAVPQVPTGSHVDTMPPVNEQAAQRALPQGEHAPSRAVPRSDSRRYRALERAAIVKLSRELGLAFQEGIAYQTSPSRRLVFDAVAFEANKVVAAEVRIVFSELLAPHRLEGLLLETERVAERICAKNMEFVLHVVAVVERQGLRFERIRENFHRLASRFDYNIKVHVFDAQELEVNEEQG